MSAPEHGGGDVAPAGREPSHGGGNLGGVKRLMGKKVLGIPVIFLVLAAAAAGLYLMRRSASTNAGTAGDATSDGYTDGSGVTDPGGVSGLGAAGLDPSGVGGVGGGGSGMTATDAQDLRDSLNSLGDAVASVQFPSGNPSGGGSYTADPIAGISPTVVAAAQAQTMPKRTPKAPPRGGQSIAVKPKVHPVVAARGKAAPAATNPAKPKAAMGKPNRKPAVAPRAPSKPAPKPAGSKPAPKPTTPRAPARGRAHR